MGNYTGSNQNNLFQAHQEWILFPFPHFGWASWTISGLGGNDILTGSPLNDTIMGGNGNDILDGGGGADRLEGGRNDDIYIVDSRSDRVIEQANQGFDTVRSSAFGYVLPDNVERLELIGNAKNGIGNRQTNTIVGNNFDNGLSGGPLSGEVDTLEGRGGDDTYDVDNPNDRVIESFNNGIDTVRSFTSSFTLPSNVERLFVLNGLSGTGNNLNNLIIGNSLDNILDGGGGADELEGQGGNDTYHVDNANDQVFELLNQGIDTVKSSVSFTLADNVENLTLENRRRLVRIFDVEIPILVGDNLNGNGNELNNEIQGNLGNNVLSGFAGNDELSGSGGNDILLGGAGNDNLNGGAGDDRLIGAGLGSLGVGEIDQLTGGAGEDTFVLGEGGTDFYNNLGNNNGFGDYALITDLQVGDRIQLAGEANDFYLEASPNNLPRGTALYREGIGPLDQDELIAIIQGSGTVGLNLNSSAFLYSN